MKRILMDLACKDEDFEFYADELQNQLDEPDEDAMVLLAYQSYDEDEQIPDIMKKAFKFIRSHKLPRVIRTTLYWFLYEALVREEI